MKTKTNHTWEWVYKMVDNISIQLQDRQSIDSITGIPKGGLIPAVLLAYQLNIPYIHLEQAQSLIPSRRRRVLLIDDIADTGYTMGKLEHFKFTTATLTKRHNSAFTPDYYGSVITDQQWIVFPWENPNSEPIQDYLNNK